MMPIIFIIVVLLIGAIAVGVFLFLRSRRGQDGGDLPPPDLGELVDYTAEPSEESDDQGLLGRLTGLPLPVKILLGLVPLLLLSCCILPVLLGMLPGGNVAEDAEDDTPSGEPALNITSARMVNESTISIIADANLPNGTEVSAELLEDGESFEWFDGDDASAEVEDGEVELRLAKASEAPAADEDSTYTVLLTAEAGGQTLEATSELTVPGPFETAFYAQPTSVPPTATPMPEPEDIEPTPESQPEPQPAPTTPPPPPSDPQGLAVTVGNGGNVRAQPTTNSEIVGGIVLGDNVSVLEKTADDIWFRVDNGQGLTGWAHQAVLLLSPEQAAQIPVQGQGAAGGSTNPPPTGTGAGVAVTVGNGGNVRAQPTVNSGVVGSLVLGDTVSVLEKTADDIWFRIDTGQGVSGWAHQVVLQLDPQQTAQVPVQGQVVAESAPEPEPEPAAEPDPAPEPPVTDEGGDDESLVMLLPSTTEGTLVAGTAQEGELTDLFAAHDWNFEGTAGQRVTIRVEAAPGEETDPRASLVDADGSVLASDDDGGGGLNAEISNYELPADGTYTVKVDVFSEGGYLITLTEGSDDAGSTSDPASEPLVADDIDDTVLELPSNVEGALTYSIPREAELNDLGAVHDWGFDGPAGRKVTIRVEAAPGEETDPRVTLVDPDGNILTADDDGGGGLNAEISDYELPVDGVYTVKVDVFAGGAYTILLTAPDVNEEYEDESEGNGSPILPPLARDARVQVLAI